MRLLSNGFRSAFWHAGRIVGSTCESLENPLAENLLAENIVAERLRIL